MPENRIIQITNLTPATTRDQIKTLFDYIGRVEDVRMYPEAEECSWPSRVGYVRFENSRDAQIALHLTNTVFIDRAIIITIVDDENFPEESFAQRMMSPAGTTAGIQPKSSNWPWFVISSVVGQPGSQVIMTFDPELTGTGLPQYPPLPAHTEHARLEEIRRTLVFSNLDAAVTPEQLLQLLNPVAEVKYIRMTGRESDMVKTALVEFGEQPGLHRVSGLNGSLLNNRPIIISHATAAIIKTGLITEKKDEGTASAKKSRSRSRSRSRSSHHSKHRRSRSRSRSRHERHKRSRSRSGSKSREHKRDKEKESSRRKEGDKDRRERERDKDRDKDRDKERSRGSDSRDKEKSRDRKEREPHSTSKGRSAAAEDPADD